MCHGSETHTHDPKCLHQSLQSHPRVVWGGVAALSSPLCVSYTMRLTATPADVRGSPCVEHSPRSVLRSGVQPKCLHVWLWKKVERLLNSRSLNERRGLVVTVDTGGEETVGGGGLWFRGSLSSSFKPRAGLLFIGCLSEPLSFTCSVSTGCSL